MGFLWAFRNDMGSRRLDSLYVSFPKWRKGVWRG